MEAHKNELESRLSLAERDDDAIALATSREKEQWRKVEQLEKMLANADQNDPLVQEQREKMRLIRGTLMWNFNASYKARLWRARKEVRELDVAYKEARRRSVLVGRAREDYPARTEEFARRVATLQPRIDGLSARLEATGQAQNRYLASIAVKELESQKQRLAAYSLQARYALASIYDKAATSGKNEEKEGEEAAPPGGQSGGDMGGAP
jgi:hypothetical protein